jgi:hypothetical protein
MNINDADTSGEVLDTYAKDNEHEVENNIRKVIEELGRYMNSKQNRAKRLRRKRRGVQKNRVKRGKK